VAEKDRQVRLIEVYNKIDAKSATTYRNKKFKKSDLLSSSRRLMYAASAPFLFLLKMLLLMLMLMLMLLLFVGRFEGVAYLNHARGKVQLVTVVVLSDVVFFLQESNQKFHFVTQDNKVRSSKIPSPHQLIEDSSMATHWPLPQTLESTNQYAATRI